MCEIINEPTDKATTQVLIGQPEKFIDADYLKTNNSQ